MGNLGNARHPRTDDDAPIILTENRAQTIHGAADCRHYGNPPIQQPRINQIIPHPLPNCQAIPPSTNPHSSIREQSPEFPQPPIVYSRQPHRSMDDPRRKTEDLIGESQSIANDALSQPGEYQKADHRIERWPIR